VTKDEIDKLVASAGEWLAGHPERDVIVRRYLRHQPRLAAEAIARLLDEDSGGETASAAGGPVTGEHAGCGTCG